MWYNDNLLYDVSYITKQVVPSVECGYPYDYQLYQVYPDKDGYEVVAPLPLEVKFTYNGAAKYVAIQISKCNPIGENSSVDSDCNDGTLPEKRDWLLRIKISLIQPDPIGPSLGTLDFPAQITDPCLADEVKFTNVAAGPIQYTIRNNAVV